MIPACPTPLHTLPTQPVLLDDNRDGWCFFELFALHDSKHNVKEQERVRLTRLCSHVRAVKKHTSSHPKGTEVRFYYTKLICRL